MAVELRCPDCRAKLRLKEAPDPGSEVECPECNAIFPAPDPDTGEVPDERGPKKAKKPGGEAPKKEAAEKPKSAVKKKDKTPKKRKAIKKETNKAALTAIIVGAVLFLTLVVGLLVWFFTRTPAAYEMMGYLPEDSTEAVGLNINHMQKYAEFIKVVEPTYRDLGFQKAIDTAAAALGVEVPALTDYMVEGWGKSGGAVVIRTKKEFDPADLKKLPGAQEGKSDGQAYYSINPIAGLFGGGPLKAFAPSKRIIVFCEYNISGGAFSKMLTGNRDGETLIKRYPALCSRITRGTFWVVRVLDSTNRPQPPVKDDKDGTKGALQAVTSSSASKSNCLGFKASLGSRDIRFEIDLAFEDSENASDLYKKFKDDALVQAQDDSSKEPPRWWKEFTNTYFAGSSKVSAELMTNLSATYSGGIFIIRSKCDTANLMSMLSGLVSKMTGKGSSMGPGMGPGMGGPGGAPMPGGPGAPGGAPPIGGAGGPPPIGPKP